MVLASPKHCMTPSVLGLQLQLRLHLHQWPSMASHSTEPQLLCVTPSCLQNQYHLGDPYTLPSPATAQGTTLAISGTQPLCSQKILPRRCHLNDAGLLIITNFLASANEHQLSQWSPSSLDYKDRDTWLKLPSSATCWSWNMPPPTHTHKGPRRLGLGEGAHPPNLGGKFPLFPPLAATLDGF